MTERPANGLAVSRSTMGMAAVIPASRFMIDSSTRRERRGCGVVAAELDDG